MVYPLITTYHDIVRIFVSDDLYASAQPRADWFRSRWIEFVGSKRLTDTSPSIQPNPLSEQDTTGKNEDTLALGNDYLPVLHCCSVMTVARNHVLELMSFSLLSVFVQCILHLETNVPLVACSAVMDQDSVHGVSFRLRSHPGEMTSQVISPPNNIWKAGSLPHNSLLHNNVLDASGLGAINLPPSSYNIPEAGSSLFHEHLRLQHEELLRSLETTKALRHGLGFFTQAFVDTATAELHHQAVGGPSRWRRRSSFRRGLTGRKRRASFRR
ncbi:hypothetical protein L7F22_036628 [Adiantum nelumboides]|nr:hypothetical protein [Adiantum nelumboides]